MLTWVDYTIVAVIGLSALLSLVRGFMREALSLLGFILAFWVALTFTARVAQALSASVGAPTLRLAAGFIILFVGTLVVTRLVTFLVGKLVRSARPSIIDRLCATVFGGIRGALIVAILVLLAGLSTLPSEPSWEESTLVRHFERLALEIRALLPAEAAAHFALRPIPS